MPDVIAFPLFFMLVRASDQRRVLSIAAAFAALHIKNSEARTAGVPPAHDS
jgi:hypothetical protein